MKCKGHRFLARCKVYVTQHYSVHCHTLNIESTLRSSYELKRECFWYALCHEAGVSKLLLTLLLFCFRYSTLASARASHEMYKNPGRIENYVPGRSSVVDKEAKQVKPLANTCRPWAIQNHSYNTVGHQFIIKIFIN